MIAATTTMPKPIRIGLLRLGMLVPEASRPATGTRVRARASWRNPGLVAAAGNTGGWYGDGLRADAEGLGVLEERLGDGEAA